MPLTDMHPAQIFDNMTDFFSSHAGHVALLSALGYNGAKVSQELSEKIRIITSLGMSRISLDLVMTKTPMLSCNKTAIIGKDIIVASRKWARVASCMEGVTTLHCFAITLGRKLESLMEKMEKKSIFDAYALDCFGSLFAEKVADELETMLRNSLDKKGRRLSRRFSPGYCDWNLAEGQRALSEVLLPGKINVTFLPGGAMQPCKTVSGVMLSADVVHNPSPCSFCKDKTCRQRRSHKNDLPL